jgi:hypothetical protein
LLFEDDGVAEKISIGSTELNEVTIRFFSKYEKNEKVLKDLRSRPRQIAQCVAHEFDGLIILARLIPELCKQFKNLHLAGRLRAPQFVAHAGNNVF